MDETTQHIPPRDGPTGCCSQYLNNRIEQDHRDIKGRYQRTRGFGSFVSAGQRTGSTLFMRRTLPLPALPCSRP